MLDIPLYLGITASRQCLIFYFNQAVAVAIILNPLLQPGNGSQNLVFNLLQTGSSSNKIMLNYLHQPDSASNKLILNILLQPDSLSYKLNLSLLLQKDSFRCELFLNRLLQPGSGSTQHQSNVQNYCFSRTVIAPSECSILYFSQTVPRIT